MLQRLSDPVRWRNRARYWLKDLQERLVLGNSLRDTPSFSFNDQEVLRWKPHVNTAGRQQRFVECPQQAGLWVCTGILERAEIESVRQFAAAACGPLPWETVGSDVPAITLSAPVRTSSHWPWHMYDPARCVAPILLGPAAQDLFEFEVFDDIPPERWLRLGHFRRHETAAVGSRVLNALPRQLRSRLQGCCATRAALLGQMAVCSFLQLQVPLALAGLT